MVLMKKCCCCTVKTASWIFGVLGGLGGVYLIVSGIIALQNPISKEDLHGWDWAESKKQVYVDLYAASAYMAIIFGVVGCIVYLTLIVGVIKENQRLLVPALVFIPVKMLKSFIFLIANIIMTGSAGFEDSFSATYNTTIIVVTVIEIVISICTFAVIFNFRKYLVKGQE